MLDIKWIKENAAYAKERLATRQKDFSAEIDRLLELDAQRRALIADTEAKKAEQNKISKSIPLLKKEGKDVAPIFAEMKALSETVKAETEKISGIDAEMEGILLSIPNVPNAQVPIGKDDKENAEIRRWSTPREFSFEAKPSYLSNNGSQRRYISRARACWVGRSDEISFR